ncbi:MAG: hypothetical protein BWZ01_01654 [Deltaproteobacteria bacterium ADurb.BinA179]|nr:DUF177 domain-containing protein [Deltaproteobacteria bacterium]MDI9543372.1 DUF177 domain-containing protein [Pseudomonadota bacterium]NLW66318.1 DUF177 domain-containing protein [Bacteriovoracaceae bacterium]OPZ27398.1 MAG: hypothetical protein BWZ01_01654 [Deltaproteobacteria bacterium ADurb.BinA179]HRR21268.1 DUF177 domain-containing protein [Desulfomonilia bacterium]
MEKLKRIEDIQINPEVIGEAGMENDVLALPEALDEVFRNKDLRVKEPFAIHYVVQREKDSQDVHVSVDVSGEIETFCVRCLETMTHSVDLHLETDYMPASPEMSKNLEEERVSSETGYYRKSIRLGDYIASELVLALPLRFICDERCKGLCPGCGANLNKEECRCEKKPVDPRLHALAELKEKIRKE